MGVSINPGATAFTVMFLEAIFYGDGFGKADQTGFTGDVVGLASVAHFRHDTGDVDDAAGAGAHHDRQRLLGAKVGPSQICGDYGHSNLRLSCAWPGRLW